MRFLLLFLFISCAYAQERALSRKVGNSLCQYDLQKMVRIRSLSEIKLGEIVAYKTIQGFWRYAQITMPPADESNTYGLIQVGMGNITKGMAIDYYELYKLP